jgi:uracil-DNA glycosylase
MAHKGANDFSCRNTPLLFDIDGQGVPENSTAADDALPPAWAQVLPEGIADAPLTKVGEERRNGIIVYPPQGSIFTALRLTSPENVRVVILGQDPYHGPGEAMGLAFAVPESCPKMPPSLRNILKELKSDLGIDGSTDLRNWAAQGVLMLNTTLSVREHQPMSHSSIGWQPVTDAIISAVSAMPSPTAFILWGRPAQMKRPLIDETRHAVFASPHPSPLSASRGFFGSRPFSRVNEWLKSRGRAPIEW